MNFVMCINDKGNQRHLKLHVVYKVLGSFGGLVCIADKAGKERLYVTKRFVPVQIPEEVQAMFEEAIKK